jgi:hypothetical protein
MPHQNASAESIFEYLAKEFAMTRLIQSPSESMSAATRVPSQAVAPSTKSSSASEDSRPLAGMLLAAVMAALLVAADQVIDSWVDGHLLAAWVALWTVTFAALALLATPLRQVANTGARWVAAWSHARAAQQAEEQMWEFARHDPRVMMEIRMASLRQTQGL